MNFFVQYYPGIIALCKMYKVKRLFAFGSVLTNRFTDKSDIDLVVDFDKEKVDDYFSNFFDLKYALEKLLGRKVDLLEEQAIRNPYLKEDIDMTKNLYMDNYTKKHLQDILTAIEEIESFFGGCQKCFDDFSQTLWCRRAIERNIEIIGEAMNRILKANPSIEISNSRK